MQIPETMKALTVRPGPVYQLERIPTPRAGEGEVLIKVEACGICAGDVKARQKAGQMWNRPDNPDHSIPGHEFFGTVVEIGEGITAVSIGDRVISEQIVPCWNCRFCKTGHYWMCRESNIYGFRSNPDGGMAEYMIFPAGAIIHKLPADMPMEQAVLIEPYACGKHCVDRSKAGNEDVVVLSGAGCLGLGMLGALKLRQPKQIIVLDVRDDRLAKAKAFGADLTMNPAKEPVADQVRALTDGLGCDIYIEATGYPQSVEQGLDMIRSLGTFVEFGVFNDKVTTDWTVIGDRKELNVLGSHLGPYCYEPVIEWLASGKLPSDGVVTHQFPLERWEEAFVTAQSDPQAIKVVLVPGLQV